MAIPCQITSPNTSTSSPSLPTSHPYQRGEKVMREPMLIEKEERQIFYIREQRQSANLIRQRDAQMNDLEASDAEENLCFQNLNSRWEEVQQELLKEDMCRRLTDALDNLERNKAALEFDSGDFTRQLLSCGQEIRGCENLAHDLVEELISALVSATTSEAHTTSKSGPSSVARVFSLNMVNHDLTTRLAPNVISQDEDICRKLQEEFKLQNSMSQASLAAAAESVLSESENDLMPESKQLELSKHLKDQAIDDIRKNFETKLLENQKHHQESGTSGLQMKLEAVQLEN